MSSLRLMSLRYHTFGPIDLTIAAGDCAALSGPSGSGKSLMLRAIADLDQHSGGVFLDDTPAEDEPAPRWRCRVGLLLAEPQWWEDRVEAHFMAGCRTPEDATGHEWSVIGLLERVGFEKDVLGWTTSRLSSGERQRLGLVRLLERRPDAMLLDEPTASLDPANVERVETLIADYRHNFSAATLWVSHDPGQIPRIADRGYRLEDGRLNPQDLP